jgi:hypothetical protein
MINKSPEMMAAIQNRDEFHGAETGGGKNLHHKSRRPKEHSFRMA